MPRSGISFSLRGISGVKRPGFWAEPRDGCEDVPVLSAAGVYADEAGGEAEARPLLSVIEAILEADRTGPAKQRHTAKRIFERLRDEHGFAGGYTVVKDYVLVGREAGRRSCRWLIHAAMRRSTLAKPLV